MHQIIRVTEPKHSHAAAQILANEIEYQLKVFERNKCAIKFQSIETWMEITHAHKIRYEFKLIEVD